MNGVKIQFVSVFVLILLLGGASTGSFFNDKEQAPANVLAAGSLDARVDGEGFEDAVCSVSSKADARLFYKNGSAMKFLYEMFVPEVFGDETFCSFLMINARRNGEVVYDGSLAGLHVGPLDLEGEGLDEWQFIISLLPTMSAETVHDKRCSFETVFAASQGKFLEGEGFHDFESVNHSIIGKASSGDGGDIVVENENEAEIENEVIIISNTGGNEAGDESEEGEEDVETGDSETEVIIENEVNTNETDIETSCDKCGECENECPPNEEEEEEVEEAVEETQEEEDSKPLTEDEQEETEIIEEEELEEDQKD